MHLNIYFCHSTGCVEMCKIYILNISSGQKKYFIGFSGLLHSLKDTTIIMLRRQFSQKKLYSWFKCAFVRLVEFALPLTLWIRAHDHICHRGKTMKCVKHIKPGGWCVFVRDSLNVPNCAIQSKMHLLNTVELLVFKGPWINEINVAFLSTTLCL